MFMGEGKKEKEETRKEQKKPREQEKGESIVGTAQTRVCLQVLEVPEAEAAAEVDGDSSSVVSPCSSL